MIRKIHNLDLRGIKEDRIHQAIAEIQARIERLSIENKSKSRLMKQMRN